MTQEPQRSALSAIFTACFVALVSCLGAAQASGQTVENDILQSKGLHAERNYFSPEPWEHFDPVTGNVILTFTDLTLPGNAGRSLQFQRVYNNQAANYPENPLVSRWSFGFPGIVMRVIEKPNPLNPPSGFQFNDSINQMLLMAPVFITSDGARHRTVYTQRPVANNSSTLVEVVSGQFYKYNQVTDTLFMPDGTVCRYDSNGYLKDFRDAFGNEVTLTRSPELLVVTQSLVNGESRTVALTLDGHGLPTEMAFDGRLWHYTYQSGPWRDIERVQPPVGPGWRFEYNFDLIKVTTSNGGTVEYGYEDMLFYAPNDPDPSHGTALRVLRTRTSGGVQHPGTWQINLTIPGGSVFALATDIITPSGTKVVYENLANLPGARMLEIGGLTTRTIWSAGGQRLETRRSQRVAVPIAHHTSSLSIDTTEPGETTVIRYDGSASRTYAATYTYRPSTLSSPTFGDYHRPTTVAESGDLTRSTSRTYQHLTGTPFIVGNVLSETTVVDGQSFNRTWTYSSSTGFRTSETVAGIRTVLAPDNLGNVGSVTKANNKTTSFTYRYGQVKDTSTPEYVVSREINADGTVASETRAGRTTSYGYDPLGRITSVQPPGGTNAIVTEYDLSEGAWTRTTRHNSVLETRLDGFGRPIATVNSIGVRTVTEYDAEGRKVYESYPFRGDGRGIGTTIQYDHLDRVTREINPDDSFRQRTYTLDSETVADENNHPTVYSRRAFGHPDDARLTRLADAKGEEWNYTYDVVGTLTAVNGPGGVSRTWTYNGNHLLSQESHPESGVVSYTSYDGAGVLKRKTDARGTAFEYEHDGNDRIKSVTAGSRVTRIEYENGSDNQRLAAVGNVSSAFAYDDAGRPRFRTDTIDGRPFTTQYQYDNNDNLREIAYPSGRHVHYDFDRENRIERVHRPFTNETYATGFRYHPSGALTEYTVGGIATTVDIHPERYRVSGIHAGALQLTYGYDRVGNVTSIGDSRGSDRSWTFGYDELDRLTAASGIVSLNRGYDAHGNRKGSGEVYTSNPFKLASYQGLPIGYDNNGNLTSASQVTYAYTADNLLESTTSGTHTTFAYDADGWRVKKVSGPDVTYFVRGPNGQLLAESSTVGPTTTIRDYIYAGSRLIAAARSATEALPPGAFDKSSPAPGAIDVPLTTTLTWSSASGATSYQYCLDTSANGSCDTGWVSVGAATSVPAPGLATGTQYSWHVRAQNANGITESDGGWWSFTTARPHSLPVEHTFAFAGWTGRFLVAEEGGGGTVNVNRNRPFEWETFTIVDVNGGGLLSGDTINLRTINGHYVQAIGGGGGAVLSEASEPGPWETFVIERADGSGSIGVGDKVAFRTETGHYLRAINGGGSGADARGTGIGVWERFRVSSHTHAPPWVLNSSESLHPNESRQSAGGDCTLTYQGDGNLVLTCGSSIEWESGTANDGPIEAAMQGDGNFVIYGNHASWSSNTVGHHGAYLIIENVREISIFDGDTNQTLWTRPLRGEP